MARPRVETEELVPVASRSEVAQAAPARLSEAERAVILLAARAERDEAQEERSRREQQELQKLLGKSAAQRTQDLSDERYGDAAPRWRVSLPPAPELPSPSMPALVISAPDADAAIGRYNRLCGINHTKHHHVVEPVVAATDS